jgi:tetratricopeptide (TPR) repeat protein
VNVQLVQAPSGTVLWSHALQASLDDLFSIQDAIRSAVVSALALPVSSREQHQLHQDVPASAQAYEHYLKANKASASSSQWHLARDLYRRAVEIDPSYAPAWARLGRCLRVMGKYGAGSRCRQLSHGGRIGISAGVSAQPRSLAYTQPLYPR